MKKVFELLLVIMILLFFASNASAQTWHQLNQGTLQWEHPGTLSNGDPIPAGDTAFFRVWIKLGMEGIPIELSNDVQIVGIDQTYTKPITVSDEGRFFAGVDAVRWVGGDSGIEQASTVAWSYDPASVTNGEIWGIESYYAPAAPTQFAYANVP